MGDMLLATPNRRLNGFFDFISSSFSNMLRPRRTWRHSRGAEQREKERRKLYPSSGVTSSPLTCYFHLARDWQLWFTEHNYHFDPNSHRKASWWLAFSLFTLFESHLVNNGHAKMCLQFVLDKTFYSAKSCEPVPLMLSGVQTSRKRAKWKMCLTLEFRSVRPVLTYLAELLYIFICRISSVKCKCSVRMVLTLKHGLPRFTCHQT